MCYFPQKVVLQGNHYVKGSNIDINKMQARLGSATFSFSNVQKIILQFGLYVVKRYGASSSFIDATSICRSICFHLGMQKMHKDVGTIHYKNILLSLGFEMCILYVEDYLMG
jgi:hypothetical protein